MDLWYKTFSKYFLFYLIHLAYISGNMFFTGVFWSVLPLNTLGEESVVDVGTDVNINGDDKMDQRKEF